MSEPKTTLPKGSWVLITGVTGFVGSHLAKQFLERGYRVRGTVRDPAKATWVTEKLLKTYADRGDLELAHVPDIGADHAFDEAVKGVAAIAHVASVVTFDPDPNKVIPTTVAGTVSILDAALREPSVKEFVYTSSIVAAAMPMPGVSDHVGPDSWNETAVQLAWAPPPYEPSRGPAVYMASKVAAEKEVWKFVREKKPHFTVNAINPASILGQALDVKHTQGVGAWVKVVYDSKPEGLQALSRLPMTFAVDVKDVALLHLAAVLDPEVKNERIQAWGWPINWNDVLAFLRRLRPQRTFPADFPNGENLTLTTDESLALKLLKKWGGQDGWKPLEETVKENVDSFDEV